MTDAQTRTRVVVLCALLLAACSDAPLEGAPDAGGLGIDAGSLSDAGTETTTRLDPMKSGSRLLLRMDRAEGGAFRPRDFYDTQLGTHCSFRRTGDTAPQYHCLPVLSGVSFAYRDAACTDRVALATPSPSRSFAEGDLVYGSERTWSGCHVKPFRLGTTLPDDGPLHHRTSGGDCLPTSRFPSELIFAVSDGSLEDFVAGTENVVDFPHGLQAAYVEGADGSTMFAQLREEGVTCVIKGAGDSLVCGRDFADSNGTLFADSACTGTELAEVNERPGVCGAATPRAPLRIARHSIDPQGCWHFEGFFAVGAKHQTAREAASACSEVSFPETAFYERGAALSLETLPRIKNVMIGSARLRVLYFAALDGTLFESDSQWRDEELGLACFPRGTADGKFRCMPDPVGTQERFSDAGCTDRIWGHFHDPCNEPLGAETPVRYEYDGEGRIASVRSLEPFSGPQFELQGETCVEVEPLSGHSYYRPGSAVALDHFAEIERIDPGAE